MEPQPQTATPAPAPAGAFTTGGLLLQTLRVWWRNALAFTAVSLVLELPLVALDLRAGKGAAPNLALLYPFSWLMNNVVGVGALSWGVLQDVAGNRPRPIAMLATVASRLWPVFAVSAVYWSLVLVMAIPLILPGVMVILIGYVSVPAILAEPELNAFDALRRSWRLTQGHRWQLFWAVLGFSTVQLGAALALEAVTEKLPRLPFAAAEAIGAAVSALVLGFVGVSAAVAYLQLRAVAPRERDAEQAEF